jgi:hypothetical protein
MRGVKGGVAAISQGGAGTGKAMARGKRPGPCVAQLGEAADIFAAFSRTKA